MLYPTIGRIGERRLWNCVDGFQKRRLWNYISSAFGHGRLETLLLAPLQKGKISIDFLPDKSTENLKVANKATSRDVLNMFVMKAKGA
jgi:hypothetical protein